MRDITRAFKIDLRNIRSYGHSAPRYGERIWVNPAKIRFGLISGQGYESSGTVQRIGVPTHLAAIDDPEHFWLIDRLRRHWDLGESWDEVGEISRLSRFSRFSRWNQWKSASVLHLDHDSWARALCNRYDLMFQDLSRAREMKQRQRVSKLAFRESGGVLVHILADGMPVFGGGNHRFAAARVLNFQRIPAQLGIVHPEAIQQEALSLYRTALKSE